MMHCAAAMHPLILYNRKYVAVRFFKKVDIRRLCHMNRGLNILVVGLFILMECIGVVTAASESGVEPVRVEGNPEYSDLAGCTGENVRIDVGSSYPSGSQGLAVEAGQITLTINSGTDIEWESDVPISCVIVKCGNAANVYRYKGGATEDRGLIPPDYTAGDSGRSSPGYSGIAAIPEFPAIAMPVGILIGTIGLIYAVKKKN
jgi:hypothetical protein